MSRKKSRRTPRKPTGTTGHLSLDPHTRTAEFVMVKFPSTKPEIEQYVLDCTLAIVRKMGRNLYRLTAPAFQNFEQDFDFELFQRIVGPQLVRDGLVTRSVTATGELIGP